MSVQPYPQEVRTAIRLPERAAQYPQETCAAGPFLTLETIPHQTVQIGTDYTFKGDVRLTSKKFFMVSTNRGDAFPATQRGKNFVFTARLLAGENEVSIFVTEAESAVTAASPE